jgi:hypothetical protein
VLTAQVTAGFLLELFVRHALKIINLVTSREEQLARRVLMVISESQVEVIQMPHTRNAMMMSVNILLMWRRLSPMQRLTMLTVKNMALKQKMMAQQQVLAP